MPEGGLNSLLEAEVVYQMVTSLNSIASCSEGASHPFSVWQSSIDKSILPKLFAVSKVEAGCPGSQP